MDLPTAEVARVVSTAAGLALPERLMPLDECVSPVARVVAETTELRRNHRLAGFWNWEEGRFTSRPPLGEIQLEWYRREDVPDAYVVRKGGETVWHTLSRTWAFLLAADTRRASPFVPDGLRCLRRTQPGHCLPLPIGRWATAASGRCPGPSGSPAGEAGYTYPFPSAAYRDLAQRLLWPGSLPETLVARGRLLGNLALSRQPSPESMVAIPSWVSRILEQHAAALGCARLAHAACVPRRVLPQLLSFARAVKQTTTNVP